MKNFKQVQDLASAILIATVCGIAFIAFMCGIFYGVALSMWVWVLMGLLWTACTTVCIYVENLGEEQANAPFQSRVRANTYKERYADLPELRR